jgi:wyosine [tRNA(Phe)-imidazoG37] synthetase (radical SAM superfamily)
LKTRYPTYKIALITNSVLFTDPRVRVDVKDSDVELPSLDAVSQDVFEKINRPLAGLKAQDLVSGLCNFREEYRGQIWLEVFIVPGANDHEEEILKIGKAIQNIKPDRVQINSLDRPGTEAWVKAASIASWIRLKSYYP